MLQIGDVILGHFVAEKEKMCIFFVYLFLRTFTTNDVSRPK